MSFVCKILGRFGRFVDRSSPVSMFVFVVIMMLMLSMFVVNDLRGMMTLFQIQPKTGNVDYQTDDGNEEKFDL